AGSDEVFAYDAMNEPVEATAVTTSEMQTFLSELIGVIHTEAPGTPVTIGARDEGTVTNWTGLDQDFYSIHHYDYMGPVSGTISLDKDYIITEEEPTNIPQKMDAYFAGGAKGVLVWQDGSGPFTVTDSDAYSVQHWYDSAQVTHEWITEEDLPFGGGCSPVVAASGFNIGLAFTWIALAITLIWMRFFHSGPSFGGIGGDDPGQRKREILGKLEKMFEDWESVDACYRALGLNPANPADKEIIIEAVKWHVGWDTRIVAEHFHELGLDLQGDKPEIIKIVMLMAEHDGEATAKHFKKFGLDPKTDKKVIFEIAKLCARNRGGGTAEYFKNFGFDPKTDKSMIIEVAELCALQNARKTALFFRRFDINPLESEEDWKAAEKIAMICAKNSPLGASMHFGEFGFDPQRSEAEKRITVKVAEQCAKLEGLLTAKYFANFMLDPQKDRSEIIEIARLCAIQDPEGTLKYFKNFGLEFTDEEARKFCFSASRLNVQELAQGFGETSPYHKLEKAKEHMDRAEAAFASLDLSRLAVGTRSYVKLLLLEEAINKDSISSEFLQNITVTVIPSLRALESLSKMYPTLGMEQHSDPADDLDRLTLKAEVVNFLAAVGMPHKLARSEKKSGGYVEVRMPPAPYPVFLLLVEKLKKMGMVDRKFYSSTVAGDYAREGMLILSLLFYAGYPAGELPVIGEGRISPGMNGGEPQKTINPWAGEAGWPHTQFFNSIEPVSIVKDLRRVFALSAAAAARLGSYGKPDRDLDDLYVELREDVMKFFLQKMRISEDEFHWIFSRFKNFSEYHLNRPEINKALEEIGTRFREDAHLHAEFKDVVEGHVQKIEEYLFRGRLKDLIGMGLEGKFDDIKTEV
ncbi:MAG: hypothetical protein ACE5JK_07235, partial [Candidatus Omnitrophota bacterium]